MTLIIVYYLNNWILIESSHLGSWHQRSEFGRYILMVSRANLLSKLIYQLSYPYIVRCPFTFSISVFFFSGDKVFVVRYWSVHAFQPANQIYRVRLNEYMPYWKDVSPILDKRKVMWCKDYYKNKQLIKIISRITVCQTRSCWNMVGIWHSITLG